MTKVSICIPVEQGSSAPTFLVSELLRNPDADIEIIIAAYEGMLDATPQLFDVAERDARLRILPPAPANVSIAHFWIGMVAAVRGDWLTVVKPDDMIELDIAEFLEHVEQETPEVDAYGWNAFQIDAGAKRDISQSIAIPIQHHSMTLEKDAMIEAFYHWEDSSNTPKMPFGIYHAAIKRSLLETVLVNSGQLSWLTALPQYEWAARVLLYAHKFSFSSRPLSAVDVRPYQPVNGAAAVEGFPFNAGIGITAAIAEIQARVLQDLEIVWDGFGENFIRACMIDCMQEHQEEAFEAKAQAYYAAICATQGGRLAATFRPPYMAQREEDPRRGLQGRILFANRFLGNAQTAQEFYAVARSMLAPAAIIRDRPEELAVLRPKKAEPQAMSA